MRHTIIYCERLTYICKIDVERIATVLHIAAAHTATFCRTLPHTDAAHCRTATRISLPRALSLTTTNRTNPHCGARTQSCTLPHTTAPRAATHCRHAARTAAHSRAYCDATHCAALPHYCHTRIATLPCAIPSALLHIAAGIASRTAAHNRAHCRTAHTDIHC
jgi:hypothetical protein